MGNSADSKIISEALAALGPLRRQAYDSNDAMTASRLGAAIEVLLDLPPDRGEADTLPEMPAASEVRS